MFTHFDEAGNSIMVDITHKNETARTAVATGTITMSPECYQAIADGAIKKGDVLNVARLAGIMATKKTAELIPLCHNIPIEKVSIDFEQNPSDYTITATCTVRTTGKTGVEMEALTGINVALLTIYDMCKAVDKRMCITDICLQEKQGGKHGDFSRSLR